MLVFPSRDLRSSQGRERQMYRERPVVVAEPPRISGPCTVDDNPVLVEYEIVAKLFLPAPDTEVTSSVSVVESSDHADYIDVQWTTSDAREPRGVWERSTVVTLPRQFAISSFTVTGDAPLLEREAGA